MPLTDDEMLEKYGGAPGAVAASPTNVGMEAALASQQGSRNAPSDLGLEQQRFLDKLGAQPGVPFHAEGLPVWMDMMVKARQNTEDQMRYLASRVGAENVRLNEMGEPVVRMKNEATGQMEDYPVSPHQLNMRSLTGLATTLPEVIGAGLALRFGGATGMLARSALASAGASLGTVLKSVGTQLSDRGAISPSQTTTEAGKTLVENFVADMGLGAGFKALQIGGRVATGKGVPNPLAGTRLFKPANPELTGEGVAAANDLAALTGIQPELTPAETTGIPFLAQAEAMATAKPAGAATMIAQQTRRARAAKAIQNWAVKPETLGTDEEVGRRGLAVLSDPVRKLTSEIETLKTQVGAQGVADEALLTAARNEAIREEQLALVARLQPADIPVQGVPKSELGDALRTGALSRREASETAYNALYDKFFAFPEATQKVISEGGPLRREINDTLKSLPAAEKTVKAEAGETIERVPFTTPIRARLEDLSDKLKGGRVSLNDLKQLRTDVGNEITYGQAVTGTKDARLTKLYSQLSNSIESALREIDNPEMTQAWKEANAAYAAHAAKFTEKTVAPFFKEAEQAGSLGQQAFVNKLLSNPDAYKAAKTFFGAGSAETASIQKIARDDLLERSLAGGETIDGKKFVTALENMRATNPKLFQEALGGNGPELIKQANDLSTLQGDLPLEELAKLISSRKPVSKFALATLELKQAQLRKAYGNSVVKEFLSGDMSAAELHPDRLIGYLATEAKLSDTEAVMAQLRSEAPDVARQVERKTLQTLFQRAARNPTPADTLAQLKREQGDLISSTALKAALGRGDQLARYEAMLGPDLRDFMVKYAKMELLGEEKRRIGAQTGLLAKGQDVSKVWNMLRPGAFSAEAGAEASGIARTKLLSIILSSKNLSRWLLRPDALADWPKTIQGLMASEEFIQGAIEEFGNPGDAYKEMARLRAGVPVRQSILSDQDMLKKYQTTKP